MSLQRSSGETETPTTSCTRCGRAMRLKFVAPSYVSGNEEMQTYQIPLLECFDACSLQWW